MTLPFPEPLPVLSRALSLATLPAASPVASAPRGAGLPRSLADLTPALDAAQRALRELEQTARCVPGAIAAELFTLAGDAATEIETVGFDLFLAVGEAGR